MSTTLSLEASKVVHALIGDYGCENYWYRPAIGIPGEWELISYKPNPIQIQWFPAPTFAELVRVLPRIGEKKGLNIVRLCHELAEGYMSISHFQSEPEAMIVVEAYLMKLLQ